MIKVQMTTSAESYTFQLPESFKLTKNFTLGEMANKEGNPLQPQYIFSAESQIFMDLFQAFREAYGHPIVPTSGHRQVDYNKKVSEDSTSLHLWSCAVDFVDKYNTDYLIMIAIWLRLLEVCSLIGAINIYTNGDTHRYHLEAFSNVHKKYTHSRVRVYSNKAEYIKVAQIYKTLGYEVTYHGSN